MSEKPIIFSMTMVRAILEGRNTMTRRVIKNTLRSCQEIKPSKEHTSLFEQIGLCTIGYLKPSYSVGDILWVRETWADTKDGPGNIHYQASATKADLEWLKDCGVKWKPPKDMPREAARIFLKVTGVRAERLQDISEEDAKAEGVLPNCEYLMDKGCSRGCVDNHNPTECGIDRHKIMFEVLWNTLNAKRNHGWDANPWVWVISFERVEGKK
jgi:hypothetical protein